MSLGPLSVETAAPVTRSPATTGSSTAAPGWPGRPRWSGSTWARRWTTRATTPGRRTWCSPTSAPGPSRPRRSRSARRRAQGDRGQPRGLVLEDTDTDPSESAWLQTGPDPDGHGRGQDFTYATLRGDYDETKPIGVSDPASRPTPDVGVGLRGHRLERAVRRCRLGPAGVDRAAVRLLRGRRAGLLPGAGAPGREAAAADLAAAAVWPTTRRPARASRSATPAGRWTGCGAIEHLDELGVRSRCRFRRCSPRRCCASSTG
jgi:hypothetical protein